MQPRALVCWCLLLVVAVAVPASEPTQPLVRSLTVADQPLTWKLPLPTQPGQALAIALGISLETPATIQVTLLQGQTVIVTKRLHAADSEFFTTLQPAERPYAVRLSNSGHRPAQVTVRLWQIGPFEPDGELLPELEPNDTPEAAQQYRLGQTVVAGAADETYRSTESVEDTAWDQDDIAEDWFRLQPAVREPRLAYVWIDLLDREIPVDLTVFRESDEGLVEADPGFEKFEPERSTPYVGLSKFRSFVVRPGERYLIRVRARHPAYLLRSATYELPPYLDRATEPTPQELADAASKAVRVAQDYVLLRGEAWHANTPRTGAVANRWRNVHAETAQCIACHPTQFSTRGALTSIANGYPLRRREQLDFLADRLYNNPRPFYGFPEAAWTRVISAAANSLSRPSVTLRLFERHVSGRPIEAFHRAVAEYLFLYYDGRTELPADESNGNRPLVSAYEVALHSWQVSRELAERGGPGSDRYARLAERLERLIASDQAVNDMLDLCYQTLAFCRIDRDKYAEQIRRNVTRILSYQRADGKWPMRFEKDAPSAEFQTGHCLYVLAVAGLDASHPAVRRGLVALLAAQEPFGGWYDDADPKRPHPYENFRTPFRETQFALMALSQLFPGRGRHVAADRPGRPLDWSERMRRLDAIGYRADEVDLALVADALRDSDPLVRRLALAACGRLRAPQLGIAAAAALADDAWIVRRAAAWAVRHYWHDDRVRAAVRERLTAAVTSTRRAALLVFQQHFRFWTDDSAILELLLKAMTQDPDPVCRMLASRALWRWWHWAASESVRARIEDALLDALLAEKDSRVVINLQEAVYNVFDENVRYLYNNWIARLARPQWRARAQRAQRQTVRRQAEKLLQRLARADDRQAVRLLRAVGWFHLRGPVVGKGRERRIGNDVETIRFYGEAGQRFAVALEHYLTSPDQDVRRAAVLAALTLRDVTARSQVAPTFVALAADPDPQARAVALRFAAAFMPKSDRELSGRWLETIEQLIDAPTDSARALGFRLAARAAAVTRVRERQRLAALLRAYLRAAEQPAPDALYAVAEVPELHADRGVLRALRRALAAEDHATVIAAAKVVLTVPALATSKVFRRPLDELNKRLKADRTLWRELLREAARDAALAREPHVAVWTAAALEQDDSRLQAAVLDLIRKVPELSDNAAVRLALEKFTARADGRARVLAQALYTGAQQHDRRPATQQPEVSVAERLDRGFFERYVQPIFFKKGPDGQACVDCHLNHGILDLKAPAEGLSFEEVTEHNYRSALRVVDLDRPERSLLLRKPLSDASREGIVGGGLSHGGDVRWPDGERSQEYRIILDWLNGARDRGTAARPTDGGGDRREPVRAGSQR